MSFWLRVAYVFSDKDPGDGPDLEDPERFVPHKDFTCSECKFDSECEFAYDLYNTGGECLQLK